jgi:hypothetical protein
LLDEAQRDEWRVFYIDADEHPEPLDWFEGARTLADERRRRVPTRAEWFLAALKLRGNPDAKHLFEDRWEWCADGENGTHWVCGGTTQLEDTLVPVPQDGDTAELLQWLTDPLVMQLRPDDFGDGLVSVRTIRRVCPPEGP